MLNFVDADRKSKMWVFSLYKFKGTQLIFKSCSNIWILMKTFSFSFNRGVILSLTLKYINVSFQISVVTDLRRYIYNVGTLTTK